MKEFLTNPFFLVIATIILTSTFNKYIDPVLPDSKVINKKMKPIIGKLSDLLSRLFIIAFFLWFPILLYYDKKIDYEIINNSINKYVFASCLLTFACSMYILYSVTQSYKKKIEDLKNEIDLKYKKKKKIILDLDKST